MFTKHIKHKQQDTINSLWLLIFVLWVNRLCKIILKDNLIWCLFSQFCILCHVSVHWDNLYWTHTSLNDPYTMTYVLQLLIGSSHISSVPRLCFAMWVIVIFLLWIFSQNVCTQNLPIFTWEDCKVHHYKKKKKC
jgi:hypothetical protein